MLYPRSFQTATTTIAGSAVLGSPSQCPAGRCRALRMALTRPVDGSYSEMAIKATAT